MNKKSLLTVGAMAFATIAAGCTLSSQPSSPSGDSSSDPTSGPTSASSSDGKATYVTVLPCSYDDVHNEPDMAKFLSENYDSDRGFSHDGVHEYGFVNSVWHQLTINDVTVPVYSTRCGYNVHSFAYVDIDTDGAFELNVTLSMQEGTFSKAIVLPESKGVSAKVSGGSLISCKINDFGDYTICLGDPTIGPEKAVTIYVAPERKLEVPEGYTEVTVNPGRYDDDDSTLDVPSARFTQSNAVYHFKKGHYEINSINVPTDSIVYFERGTYLEFFQGTNHAAFTASGGSMKILGRAIADFSRCVGGDAKTKGVYDFYGLSAGYVEGMININSNSWTMCFTACDNIEVTRCMCLAYRTYSDGIMLSGCKDSIVHHNFVRTGDDAIEVKATSNRVLESNNLVYEYNSVWTDKGIAYGCIYESNANITDVVFRHNSIGFAQSAWSKHLGCFVMQMGSQHTAVWSNVHFEDSEVYYAANSLMSIYNTTIGSTYYGGTIKNIYFKNLTVKRVVKTNLQPYCLNINLLLENPDWYNHMTLGKIYIDNVNYQGIDITKTNLMDYSNVSIPEDVIWSSSNIKVNTLG